MKRMLIACAGAMALATPTQAATITSYEAFGTINSFTGELDDDGLPVWISERYFGSVTLTVSDDPDLFDICGDGYCGADGSGAYYDVDRFPDQQFGIYLAFSGNSDEPAPTDSSVFLSGSMSGYIYGIDYWATFDYMKVKTWDVQGDGHNLVGFSINGPAPVVPEPATWAMMLAGFGLAGGMMRRRKVSTTFA